MTTMGSPLVRPRPRSGIGGLLLLAALGATFGFVLAPGSAHLVERLLCPGTAELVVVRDWQPAPVDGLPGLALATCRLDDGRTVDLPTTAVMLRLFWAYAAVAVVLAMLRRVVGGMRSRSASEVFAPPVDAAMLDPTRRPF